MKMAELEKLEQWAVAVEAQPDELFNMSSWAWKRDCGTAYCAAGLLPSIFPDDWHFCPDAVLSMVPCLRRQERCFTVHYQISTYFGIDVGEVERIIYSIHYPASTTQDSRLKRAVAARIRKAAKEHRT
jgi:hypothetical protein